MKTISEDLEYRKAVNEKHTTLEKEKNQNRRVVELEAQKYLEEKVRLESQIENIQQTIWEDIQDQKDKIEHSLSGNLKHREEKNQTMRCLKSCSIFKKGLKVLPKKCKNCFRKMKETNS